MGAPGPKVTVPQLRLPLLQKEQSIRTVSVKNCSGLLADGIVPTLVMSIRIPILDMGMLKGSSQLLV